MSARFKDRVCLVTGASSGIGREIACALAAEGAQVALVGRQADSLARVLDDIPNGKTVAHAFPFDLVDTARIPELVQKIAEDMGPIRHLVNAAGLLVTGRSETPDDWDAVFAINAQAPYRLISESARSCGAAGMSVVSMASIFALRATPGSTIYSASKAALIALTRNLALELAPSKVRANCIAPGAVDTPMLSSAIAAIVGDDEGDSARFYDAMARQYLMGRIVNPADVSRLCLFLLSDAAEAISGHTIPLDGGLTQILSMPQVDMSPSS